MRRIALALSIGLVLLSFSGVCAAKIEQELGYRYKNVWNAAVRFVRVDLGYKLIEKDKETGYLLFEYHERGIKSSAALELIPILKNNRQMVKLRLQISSMPSYVERVLLDKLLRKLKAEYGTEPVVEQLDPRKLHSESDPKEGDEEDAKVEDSEQNNDGTSDDGSNAE